MEIKETNNVSNEVEVEIEIELSELFEVVHRS